MTRTPAPATADVVVLGGGIIGLATAYELARAGVGRVVLCESDALGSGSTSKAAGGVRAMFSDETNILLGARSLETFADFPSRFGQEIDLHRVGYLFLLDDPEDVADFERSIALQNSLGVPSRMVSPAQAGALTPYFSTEGVLAGAYSPTDGHCTPESVVLGYAGAARRAGVQVLTGCAVTSAEVVDGAVRAVLTQAGRIETDTVVLATGAWTGVVGELFGVELPVQPLRRQILVTEPVPGLPTHSPMTIDFSTTFYAHREGLGLLLGMSDPEESFGFKLDRDDAWLGALAEVVQLRAPGLREVGLASGWAGLYEVTPDHNGLVGTVPGIEGLWVCAGFSGHGFLMGPALGECMAALITGRRPPLDVSALDLRRFAEATVPEKNIV